MGKFTGKKQRINYKPIIITAVVVLPIVFAITYFTWPQPPEPVRFVLAPTFDTSPNARGTVRIDWATNVETHCTLYYRDNPKSGYHEMTLALGKVHAVALPGKIGDRIEFYIDAKADREKMRSETFTINVIAAPASAPSSQAGTK